MKKQEFLSSSNHSDLFESVIDQIGGWKSFKESASDIARYGINGGFSGFIYYSDTVKFAENIQNRRRIIKMLEEQADEMGMEVVDMVANFGEFKTDFDQDTKRDLYRYLSETKCKGTAIPNVMAWYAAEEAANHFENV